MPLGASALLNLGSGVVPHGAVDALRARLGIDAAGIAAAYGAWKR